MMSSGSDANRKRYDDLWGIVLAGGDGQRLQPLMRRVAGCDLPKQYCAIIGRRSMLQHTVDRLTPLIPPDRILTVITRHHLERVRELLQGWSANRLIIQPENRDTAPGILLPLLRIHALNPGATVAIFPSDHFILEETVFMEHVLRAVEFLEGHENLLVLIGVAADRPDTGYGWIEPGQQIRQRSGFGLFRVRRFWEKPDPSSARQLYLQGCLWNSLVVVSRLCVFLRLIRETLPEIWDRFQGIRQTLGSAREAKALKSVYRGMPAVNLSCGLLEKIPDRLGVVPVKGVLWSDWGEEERIFETLARIGKMDEFMARLGGRGIALEKGACWSGGEPEVIGQTDRDSLS